jgi:hypothetical protein
MWKGDKKAAEKRLHALHYEVEVALQFQAVVGEDSLEEMAEAEVYVSGPGWTQSRTAPRAEYCDTAEGAVDVPLG